RISLIPDGDVAGALMTCWPDAGVDVGVLVAVGVDVGVWVGVTVWAWARGWPAYSS
ncbi:MAG TPA: fructose-bisphosphatase class II, partial [Anaerolineae bacterium]|nr:fructose-bisphosphatase class II [Anaerolineae bacterium]